MRGLTSIALLLPLVLAVPTVPEQHLHSARAVSSLAIKSQNGHFSGDVTSCQGYNVTKVSTSSTGGLLASLSLLNRCSAYGNDLPDLTLSVEYETTSRLHVHIYDSPLHQYQISDSFLPRPNRTLTGSDSVKQSDLEFEYNSSPFEFWITRKSDGQVLFDTRAKNIPVHDDQVLIEGVASNYTYLPGYPLVVEDQYLQIASTLPVGANIFGLGEVLAGSGYRRNSSGTVQTFWARDIGDPVDENVYGTHPMYMETRFNETTKKSMAHGVFLLNSNGMDVILRDGVIEYRAIGGTLDFYFLSGPTANDVASEYAQTVGLPQVMPFWSFGFHLCRWGYGSLAETKKQVTAMRKAGIPLEVMWNDIDWMKRYREFQYDINFDPTDYKAFVDDLHSMNQHYIMIVDAAVGILYNSSDSYNLYERGHELDTWMHNPDGTEYIGTVWPGYTVFPDWYAPQMQTVWNEVFYNHSLIVDFDGVWLDMNEPSSFVDGSAENSTVHLNASQLQQSAVNPPVQMPVNWPEGYDNFTSGISGNITVDGKLTYTDSGADGTLPNNTALRRSSDFDLEAAKRDVERKLALPRSISPAKRSAPLGIESRQIGNYVPQIPLVDEPPYPIRNGNAGLRLSHSTVSPNATHSGGLQTYSVHNIWGSLEEIATNEMLLSLKPGLRPFIVGRSTFAGIGRKTAHWLGDNYATWAYMKRSIQGVLQFNLFAIPMVGPDTCGFNANTDEELCNRWMQLSAFFPFYRNHNTKGALAQEPYRWDSVAAASITAINARYSLLPYWETLFAEASQTGAPPVRALFHEFDDPSLYDNDAQFMIGSSILVTPQLQPNQSTVTGNFPTEDGVTWTNFFTHEKLDTSAGDTVSVAAPLGSIPVHVRSGSIILMHADVEYTLTDTRNGSYGLLVTLDGKGYAEGVAKIDDGNSFPVTEQSCLTLVATSGSCLNSTVSGNYEIPQKLSTITLLAVTSKPGSVTLNGKTVSNVTYKAETDEVIVGGLAGNLNEAWELKW